MTRPIQTSPIAARPIQLAPSILSADFLNLEQAVRLLAGSPEPPEWFHLDVMDGHFVPNLTIGPPFVRALKRITEVPLDVHLMIDNPHEQLDWYLDAGADLLTFHLEAARPGARGAHKGSSATIKDLTPEEVAFVLALLERIRAAGALAGLSINPATPVELLRPFYQHLDVVLLMSVHPGFGGQSFIPESLSRLNAIRADIAASEASVLIEVDGGIDVNTVSPAVEAGAELLVAGNAIYGQTDPVLALQNIRRAVYNDCCG
ncbi:MAG: ribulose-phosphate 3-epimerase [Coriobacteriales bacterium]|nr:ribulose-phosphate 3-epimerase [Coriobacteriales bacterium]